MDRDEKRIDELLDAGLAGYSDVEPRAGIEDRIVARLGARLSSSAIETEQRTWLRSWPAWGLAVAALIAMVVILSVPKHIAPAHEVVVKEPAKAMAPVQPQHQQIARKIVPPVPVRGERHRPVKERQIVSLTTPQLAVAKRDVFPAPSPLTEQERMLFAYLRRTDPIEIAANAKPDDPPFPEKQLNQVLPVQKNSDSNTNAK